jgi:hypothetical protein
MARQRRSYAWALHTEVADVALTKLTPRARRGLDFACALASDARERTASKPNWKQRPPLTIARIAEQERLSDASVRRLIARARRELFGKISDGAIYKRREARRDREQRFCAEEGCEEEIPAGTHGNQRYCAQHATAAARARRYRRSF